jgi:hypothetical protein
VATDSVILARLLLGAAPLSECAAGDLNDSGEITIDELIRSENAALNGCPD